MKRAARASATALHSYRDMVGALRRSVLESDGRTTSAERVAASSGGPLPDDLAAYTTNVRESSYRITDADLVALQASGLSEDAVFELTVAAAVGAALTRLEAGLRALDGDG